MGLSSSLGGAVPGYDVYEPGSTGNEHDDQAHLHRPYVRQDRSDARWEVVCTECGDDEGPAEDQSPSIQQLRGPYPTRHKAAHAAHAHERDLNPERGWIPGLVDPL